MRLLPASILGFLLIAYAIFAMGSFLFFFFTRFSGPGYFLLLFALFPFLILYFQDFRLSSNPGYALILFTFLFLFIPDKSRVFRWVVVSYFVASGLLKLSPEWLTGMWFTQHWTMPVKLGEWLAALSAIVELIAPAALLFRDGRYFWTGWVAVVAYLSATWWVSGFYGPTLFLSLMVYLAAQDLENRKIDREYIYQSFVRPEPSQIWCAVLVAAFWLAIATAHVNFPGRHFFQPLSYILLPHSTAASEQCEQSTYAIYKDRVEVVQVPEYAGRPETMQCSPYLHFLDLKALCQTYSEKPNFQTIASYFNVRRLQDSEFRRAFEVRDICNPDITFKSLGLSTWTTSAAD